MESAHERLLRLQALAPAQYSGGTPSENDAAGVFVMAGADLIRGRARVICGSENVEDIASDTSLRLSQKYHDYRAHPNPEAYARTAGGWAVDDYLRHLGRDVFRSRRVAGPDDERGLDRGTSVTIPDDATPEVPVEVLERRFRDGRKAIAAVRAVTPACPRHDRQRSCSHDADTFRLAEEAFHAHIVGEDAEACFAIRLRLRELLTRALGTGKEKRTDYLQHQVRSNGLVCFDWWYYRFVAVGDDFEVEEYATHPASGPARDSAWQMPLPRLWVNGGYVRKQWVRQAAKAIGEHRWGFLRSIQVSTTGTLNRRMYPIKASYLVYRTRPDLAAIIDIHLDELSALLRAGAKTS